MGRRASQEDFGVFLYRTNRFEKEVQSKWGRRLDYNEIVVDGAHWTNHLYRRSATNPTVAPRH